MKKLFLIFLLILFASPVLAGTYTDNFNRANETPLAGNWTCQPAAGVNLSTNHLTGATDIAWQGAFWNANSFNNDQWSQGTVGTIYHLQGVTVRASASTNSFYMFGSYSSTHYRLYKVTAGTAVQLGSDYGAPVANDVIKLSVTGTVLTPYINGTPQSTVSDATFASGSAGVMLFDTSANLDDWSGGDNLGTVVNPTFTYGTGIYPLSGLSETLSDSTGGSTICYTTDGATPGAGTAGTCDSDGHTQTYSIAIPVTVTSTSIKALGTKTGMNNSSVVTATYTLRSPTTFYLDIAGNGGSDANSGTSAGSPWLSPNHSLQCGDVIIANASASYSYTNFASNKWGTVTCIGNNNVAWLKCGTFDGCKISAGNNAAMYISQSYWGVQGWETTGTADNGVCYLVSPTSSTIHHIILANNICNGGANGFAFSSASTTASFDYVAVLGNISYNASLSTAYCNSGITIYEPIKIDSNAGTHIYVAGNFLFDTYSQTNCAAGHVTTYDGNGIAIDDLGCTQTGCPAYNQQVVVDNNISVFNGGYGLGVTGSSTTAAPIYFRNNTSFGNMKAANTSTTTCGDMGFIVNQYTTAYNNLIQTNAATACSGPVNLYAVVMNGGDTTDSIYGNFLYSATGSNTNAISSDGFSFGSNTTGTTPNFVNPVDPGAPSCSGKTSVPNCMATVLANYTPQTASAKGYGYQTPSADRPKDPLFPNWLCNVNLPSGLITTYCGSGTINILGKQGVTKNGVMKPSIIGRGVIR